MAAVGSQVFGAHGGIQAGVLGAPGAMGAGFAAGDFVGQDELEEVGVGHVVLGGPGVRRSGKVAVSLPSLRARQGWR